MAEHALERHKPGKRTAVKKDAKSAVAKKVAKDAVANTEEEGGARIVVLTDDPRRSVVIVPGCHIDSMRHKENAYFFEDGNPVSELPNMHQLVAPLAYTEVRFEREHRARKNYR